MKGLRLLAGLTLVAALGAALPASADPIADFYTGKRITMIIGYGTGGGYDEYARMLARFIGAYTSWKLDPSLARNALVLVCVAIDTWRHRHLHPAFITGALLLFVTDPLARVVAGLPVWTRFCAWLG